MKSLRTLNLATGLVQTTIVFSLWIVDGMILRVFGQGLGTFHGKRQLYSRKYVSQTPLQSIDEFLFYMYVHSIYIPKILRMTMSYVVGQHESCSRVRFLQYGCWYKMSQFVRVPRESDRPTNKFYCYPLLPLLCSTDELPRLEAFSQSWIMRTGIQDKLNFGYFINSRAFKVNICTVFCPTCLPSWRRSYERIIFI